MICAPVRDKVVTTAEWLSSHRSCGKPTREPFPHPDGTWYWIVCACGDKHLTKAEAA